MNQQKIVEKYRDFHSRAGWLVSKFSAPAVDELWIKI